MCGGPANHGGPHYPLRGHTWAIISKQELLRHVEDDLGGQVARALCVPLLHVAHLADAQDDDQGILQDHDDPWVGLLGSVSGCAYECA